MAGREIRAGKAFVEITLRDKLQAGLKKAAAQLKAFASVTSAIGAGLTATSGAILAPLAAAVSQFSSVGSAIADMSARTGMGAEGLSALGYAASMTGASLEDVEKSIRKMQQNIADAAGGSKSAAKALASIGVSAADLAGLAPEQQMQRIAAGLAAIRDPAKRTSAAMDIFGRSGTALLPMMARGSAAMEAYAEEAERLGLILSSEDAAAADALGDATDRLWGTLRGVTLQIGAALAPAVTDMADRISACVAHVTRLVKENRGLIVGIAKAAIGIAVAGGAFLGVGTASLMASFAIQGFAGVSAMVTGVFGRLVGRMTSTIGSITGLGRAFSVAAARVLAFSRMGAQAGLALGAAFGKLLTSGVGSVLTLTTSLVRLGVSATSAAGRMAASMGPGLWRTITTAASASVAGVRGALSAGSSAVGALVRGWSGEIGMFTNRVNQVLWTLGAKTRAYVTTLRSGGMSQALALARSDFRQLLATATASFRGIQRTVLSTVSTLRTAIAIGLSQAWRTVQSAGVSAFARVRQAGLTTVSVVGRGISRMAGGIGRGMSRGFGGVTGALTALGGLMGGTGLGAMLTTIPLVTTMMGGLVSAVGALLSPFGLVVAVIASGIYAWSQWSQTGQTVLAGATTAFRQIYATVKEVFGGISKALAAGDITLAAEILWAGLKVVFYQGVEAIAAVWPALTKAASQAFSYLSVNLGSLFSASAATFSAIGRAILAGNWGAAAEVAWAGIQLAFASGLAWITNAWTETTTGLAILWENMVAGIRTVWNNVSSWIARQLLELVGAIQSALQTMAQYDPTGLAQGLSDRLSLDVAGALRTLEEDRQRFHEGVAGARDSRSAERAAQMQRRLAQTERQLDELRAARDAALARANAATEGAPSALAAANAELQRTLQEAGQLQGLFDAESLGDQLAGAEDGTADLIAQSSPAATGTFSAAAAMAMFGTARDDAAKETAENTRAMRRRMDQAARQGNVIPVFVG